MCKQLLLGVAQTDITPEIGARLFGYGGNVRSESIHDNLTATAFWFEKDNTRALLMSITVCSIITPLADRIRAEIASSLSIPYENCILNVTHTHTGPTTAGMVGWGDVDTDYCENIFIPKILEVAKEAAAAPVPVKMGIAQGKSYVAINRRQVMPNNRIELGQNPWGPFCPDMTVISFRDNEGNAVANMIHYGLHGTAAGKSTVIGRDWSGIMVDRLATETGAITAFFCGPEGDVGPRLSNGETVGNIALMEELGGIAASDAVRIYKDIRSFHDAPLSCLSATVRIPFDKRISPEEATAGYERFSKEPGGTAMALANHYKEVLASYENGYEEVDAKEIPQTIIKIGDVAFVSTPYELFSVIGMRIAEASPVPYTLNLVMSNGSEGYFITEDNLYLAPHNGGYEVAMYCMTTLQPYTHDADFHLVSETLKNLEDLTCTE